MKYPKLRELKEAIKSLLSKPYTSKFPYQPHEPAKAFRGKPQFYIEDCVGCMACAQVCPSGAITFHDHKEGDIHKRTLKIRYDICIFCGQCQANCLTEKGIMLTREFDLATTQGRDVLVQSIDKELYLCDGCQEALMPKDQIIWVARKLGPMIFSNTSVMLFYLAQKNLAELACLPSQEIPALRSDRFKVLCPRCRREAVLKS